MNLIESDEVEKTRELAKQLPKHYQALYHCEKYAYSLIELLKQAGIHGKYLEVTSATDFIYSDSLRRPITTNGKHSAVQVRDVIFDNFNPTGISYQNWLTDLGGEGGTFLKPPYASIAETLF